MNYRLGGLIFDVYTSFKDFNLIDESIKADVVVEKQIMSDVEAEQVVKIKNNCAFIELEGLTIYYESNKYYFTIDSQIIFILLLNQAENDRLLVYQDISENALIEMIEKTILPIIYYNKSIALPIHATAIEKDGSVLAIMGASHSGKSTLAHYAITTHEYSLITDDVMPLYISGEELYTWNMATQLRLREPSLSYFKKINRIITNISFSQNKFNVSKAFLLNTNEKLNSNEVKITRQTDVLSTILKNLYAQKFNLFDHEFLMLLSSVAKHLEIYQLSYSKNFEVLPCVFNTMMTVL